MMPLSRSTAHRQPRALDLFCGAGGATKGLQRAGFHVTGIDNKRQPRYCGDAFIQGDAMHPPVDLKQFDFIWASPPCQAYSTLRSFGKQDTTVREKLIDPVRRMLMASGRPYVIENVMGSDLKNHCVMLCGQYFGLGVRRHRLFEANGFLLLVPNCGHSHKPNPIAVYGDHPEKHSAKPPRGGAINRAHTLEMGSEAMGIDWMDWKGLTQAIPPAYSEFIGRQIMERL